jgi:hypothetical protein
VEFYADTSTAALPRHRAIGRRPGDDRERHRAPAGQDGQTLMAATYKPFKVTVEGSVLPERGAQPSPEQVESALSEFLQGQAIHISVDLPDGGFEGGRIAVTNAHVKAEEIG